MIESPLSIAVRRTAGIVTIGALLLTAMAVLLGWPDVLQFSVLTVFCLVFATMIIHLATTNALTAAEKSVWRGQLWGSHKAWVAVPLYLFARDLAWHARGFTRRGDTGDTRLPTSGVEEIYNYREADGTLATSGQPTEDQLLYVARDGFQVVINLALHGDPRYSLKGEAASVKSLGMQYVHIPVDFQSPSESDLQKFFEAMDAHRARKVLVHCAANKRVTAFVGLYRTIKLGWPVDDAFALMHSVWEPDPVWAAFISEHLREAGTKD